MAAADSMEKVYDVLSKFLGGTWAKPSNDGLIIRRFQSGFVNQVYHCLLSQSETSDAVKDVIVRIRGQPGIDEYYQIGEAAESLVMYLLGEKGLAPKVLGVFPGGRIEEYIDSVVSKREQLRQPSAIAVIARHLARKHSIDMPLPKIRTAYIDLLYNIDQRPKTEEAVNVFKNLEINYEEEVQWVKDHILKLRSKVTFCHMDLNQSNILVRKTAGKEFNDHDLVVVDFDSVSYGYPCGDFASYFSNFHFELGNSDDGMKFDSNYVTEDEKLLMIREYLRELKSLNADTVIGPEVEELMSTEIEFFILSFMMSFFAFAYIKLGREMRDGNKLNFPKLVNCLASAYKERKQALLSRHNWSQIFNV